MVKTITISFRENELEIYEWIKLHSNYSGFLKDVLKEVMIEDKNKNNKKWGFKPIQSNKKAYPVKG